MNTGRFMRVVHRYLGFFLAGIMAVYAMSGTVLIFRDTDFLKREVLVEKTIEPNISAKDLGPSLRIKGLKVSKEEGGILYFEQGIYNQATGEANYTVKELPLLIDKMTHLHKATTSHPLFWLNIFFGVSLLFFVVSAFWMYTPKTSIFKKGMYFALAGLAFALVLLFV